MPDCECVAAGERCGACREVGYADPATPSLQQLALKVEMLEALLHTHLRDHRKEAK